MRYTDIVTQWLAKFIPPCAVDLRFGPYHMEYLHPRRGWKRVSFRRIPWQVRAAWLDPRLKVSK